MAKRAVVNGKVMRTPSYEDASLSSPAAQRVADIVLGVNQEYVAHDDRTHTRDKALLVALGVNGEVPFFDAAANAGIPVVGCERGVLFANRGSWIAANDNHRYAVAA